MYIFIPFYDHFCDIILHNLKRLHFSPLNVLYIFFAELDDDRTIYLHFYESSFEKGSINKLTEKRRERNKRNEMIF